MTNTKRRSPVFIAIRIAFLAYFGLLLVMVGCQRHLIYHPSRVSEEELLRHAAGIGLREWRDGEGRLIGWIDPAPHAEAQRRAVVFHGNAGMAVQRGYYARGLQKTLEGDEWKVYIMEYPGYGARDGKPSEAAFYEAAREALGALFAEGEESVFLIGESLGSGVASRMAAEFPDRIDGLLLVTPFTNLAEVGGRHFPFLPVRLLLRERFDNVKALRDYQGPVAILLAEHDEVVPADLGQRLFDLYEGPKKLWMQKGQNHNTLDLTPQSPWWEELSGFLLKKKEE